MRGFITDRDLQQCEETFPGIVQFYLGMRDKPKTFLQLLWAFQSLCGCSQVGHLGTGGAGQPEQTSNSGH